MMKKATVVICPQCKKEVTWNNDSPLSSFLQRALQVN